MNLPRIHQILTRAISEMAGHELETINRLEEGDVIRFPGHGIPADELAELEGLLKKKPSAETTQPSKPERKAPEGPLPRQATSEKPKTVKKAQKPGRLTSLNKGQTVMIHQGGKRKDWYLERTTAGTYVAVGGTKMHRSKTLEGALRWLWKQSQGGMQRQITKVFDLDAIKTGTAPPEEKPTTAPTHTEQKKKTPSNTPKPKMSFSTANALAKKQKLETPTARLTWNDHTWTLHELPSVKKKRLRVALLTNPKVYLGARTSEYSFWTPTNILMHAAPNKNDSYDKIKQKFESAYKTLTAAMKVQNPDANYSWAVGSGWDETTVQAAKVTPAGTEPIQVQGKDFRLTAEWNKFSAKDNFSYGTSGYVESKSPGGARKVYKALQKKPYIFNHMKVIEFMQWLRKNRIGYTAF